MTVKLGYIREEKDTYTWNQERMHLRSFYIADSTGSMSLTVWGNERLSPDEWYSITNASVRNFHNLTCLSTTAQSTVTMLKDHDAEAAPIIDHI